MALFLVSYIKSKEQFIESSATDIGRTALGSVSLGGKQEEQLGNLFKVIELISDGYLSDLKTFLNRMSNKDEEIEKLVEKISQKNVGRFFCRFFSALSKITVPL